MGKAELPRRLDVAIQLGNDVGDEGAAHLPVDGRAVAVGVVVVHVVEVLQREDVVGRQELTPLGGLCERNLKRACLVDGLDILGGDLGVEEVAESYGDGGNLLCGVFRLVAVQCFAVLALELPAGAVDLWLEKVPLGLRREGSRRRVYLGIRQDGGRVLPEQAEGEEFRRRLGSKISRAERGCTLACWCCRRQTRPARQQRGRGAVQARARPGRGGRARQSRPGSCSSLGRRGFAGRQLSSHAVTS